MLSPVSIRYLAGAANLLPLCVGEAAVTIGSVLQYTRRPFAQAGRLIKGVLLGHHLGSFNYPNETDPGTAVTEAWGIVVSSLGVEPPLCASGEATAH